MRILKVRPVSACLLLALALEVQSHAGIAPSVHVLQQAHSTINGDLTVVDYRGRRMLLAKEKHVLLLQSEMDLEDHARLLDEYTQVVSLLTALQGRPERVYNMGLGGGVLPRFHLKHYATSRVDSAELDPQVIELARSYFDIGNPRHAVLEGDAFQVLNGLKKFYDVVWVDAFTPKDSARATVPSAIIQPIKPHIASNGILVANLGSSKNWERFASVIARYKEGFTHGIRVQAPAPIESESLREVGNAVGGKASCATGYYPSHVVAVGNNDALSCARFWQLFRKWSDDKLVSLKWDSSLQKSAICQDL